MARRANVFIDPNGARASYSWEVNHSSEESVGKRRNIRVSAPTAKIGLVKHVADVSAYGFHWKGSIFTRAMLVEMWHWFALCDNQTIYLTDFAGDQYEVTITNFDPVRVPLAWNPRDPVNAPNWKWEYTIEMLVIQIISGPLLDGAVAP